MSASGRRPISASGRRPISASGRQPISADVHRPVMLAEVLDALAVRKGGIYLDGTFGAGGYARGILDACSDSHVVAIDRDPAAAALARLLAESYPNRLTFIPGRFGSMTALALGAGFNAFDGIALDVGVSSMQIDQAERGFSFLREGPLDMRMEQKGPSAADIVNTANETALADILYRYGEERRSRRIARAIVSARDTQGPILTTGRLASVIRSVMPKDPSGIDAATRSFQGLRIAVNDELNELQQGLEGAERLLRAGGRLVVVSFHSLEDRLVKTFFNERRQASKSRLLPGEPQPPHPTFRQTARKSLRPGAGETALNPRARSARLRWAERLDGPPRSIEPPRSGDAP